MNKTARQCVLEALTEVTEASRYSNITLDNILSKNKLELRDKKLASAIFYGTLERKITLDHCINGFSKKPVEKLTPKVLNILRMSLYQILYMDSIPESAAVNEGVKLTRSSGVTSAAGFVNGVLRSFLRSGGKIPPIKGNFAHVLSVKYSCEEWLCKALIEQYSEKTAEDILEVSTGAPPVFIRVNTLKTNDENLIESLDKSGITAKKTSVPHCLITESGNLTATNEFKMGLFHVQDMSSQLCCAKLDPQKGERIADVCSAPGGKTFTIAEIMQDSGEIVAMDLHEKRTKLISDGAARLGIGCVNAKASDASKYNPQLGVFDRVLCDVPCSGFGIMRRKPEIKYKTADETKKLPEIQYAILENASKYVKAGGCLIYSTCTILKEENQEIIKKFFCNNKDFEPWDDNYMECLIPQKNGSDGFFICKIRRVK